MSNSSLSDFIQASAKLMLADRPDIWESHDEAITDITMAFADVTELDPDDEDEYSVHLSGFVLTRVMLDDGAYEYTISKKLLSLAVFTDEEDAHVFDWTKSGRLANIGLNLPELEEDLDIEPDISDDINYNEDEN